MKLELKTSPTFTSENMEVSKMGLDADSMDLFTLFLRNQIYTNKVLACVREYICNATDEHIKYKIDRPVEVSLESVDGRYIWKCRDFAKGLDNNGIRNIFGMYGNSTKRKDNNQTGVYGVGSKAFFSVTDTYYVTSHNNGLKTSYVCMLGGGDKGVPVGEIYKILEEPTEESGIEISADVSKHYSDFNTTTRRFVNNFGSNVKLLYTDHVCGELHVPLEPLHTHVVGDFVFSQYEDIFDSYGGVAIRMGGVVYKKAHGFKIPCGVNKIVVDVPIGKLTVPMSREDIEITPSNQRTLDAIQKGLDDIILMDKNGISVPKFGEYILSENNRINSDFKGTWFKHTFKNLFPDSHILNRRITSSDYSCCPKPTTSGKWNIFIFPNIKNNKSWMARLQATLNSNTLNTSYFYMIKSTENEELIKGSDTLDVSDCVFVDVKKLGLPKLPNLGPQTKYLVYQQCRKRGPWTPDELEEWVSKNYFSDNEIDDEWYETVTTLEDLNRRTIGHVNIYGTRMHFFTTQSKKMISAMLDIGWIDRYSDEYTNKAGEINKRLTDERNVDRAEYNLKDSIFKMSFSSRLIKHIGKNPDKLSKLKKIKHNICSEDSFRARVLNSLSSYSTTLTRQDIRKILSMK